jgi:hypothetical protein
MVRLSPFPLKQSELNDYFQIAIMHLQCNSERLGLTGLQVASLSNHLSEWNTSLKNYKVSHDRPKAVYNLSMVMEVLQNELRGIYQNLIKHSLSDFDKDILNLHNFWLSNELATLT